MERERGGVPYSRSAAVYDLIYGGKDYRGESEQIGEAILQRNPDAHSLLEVACGTGLFLEQFGNRFDVAGVDRSESMLAVARERLPGVPFWRADMRDFRLADRFDAVACLFSSIGYMTERPDLERALANMAHHLEPGGVLVVDGWLRPDAIDPAAMDGGYVMAEAWATPDISVSRTGINHYQDGKTAMQMNYLIARRWGGVEHFTEHHVLGVFDDDGYVRSMGAAGLS